MNKEEAASFLGVSVRSLARYTKAGRAPVRYEKGRTGRVLVYDEAALAALKSELQPPSLPTPARPKTVGGSVPLTLRLPGYDVGRLTEEGARYGLSAREYARQLVREGLDSKLSLEVAALRSEVAALRKAAADVIESILVDVNEVPHEDAAAWIAKHLRRG